MKEIEQNFRFMLLEVEKQLAATLQVMNAPSEEAIEAIESRDDYIDNQKSVIENLCFSKLHGKGPVEKRKIDQLRALQTGAINLERLADHAVNIVRQTRHLANSAFLSRYEYRPFFEEMNKALDNVLDAFFKKDMSAAFRICLSEFMLDRMYKIQFDRILSELRSGTDTGDLITTLFIFRYLERIGDALLNIGEAAIFAIIGEKFKIHQYTALRESIAATGQQIPISDVEFESIWGTRSGCRIGKLKSPGGGANRGVIFKEGNKKKLLQEKENIARWEKIMPGLPPKVVSLREDGKSVSLLIEYLGGCTLQDVVVMGDEETVENVLFILEQTLQEIWSQTLKPEPVALSYMAQARGRMEDVFRLYPDFDKSERAIGAVRIPALRERMAEAEALESRLAAPFTVFIHGDFNINNVLYCHEEQRIHFIDLHRSRQTDYVQDVSVFLVSNFRLPVFDETPRHRLEWTIREFWAFARRFAREHEDATFEARLCLGLARSLLTSTRFELNRRFAKIMFNRGTYLLDRLLRHAGPLESFHIGADVLDYF